MPRKSSQHSSPDRPDEPPRAGARSETCLTPTVPGPLRLNHIVPSQGASAGREERQREGQEKEVTFASRGLFLGSLLTLLMKGVTVKGLRTCQATTPLGHIDYFELKAIEGQQVQEALCDLPLLPTRGVSREKTLPLQEGENVLATRDRGLMLS